MIYVTDHCKLRWMSRVNHTHEEQDIKDRFKEAIPIGWENNHRARYHPPTNALIIWKPDGEKTILITTLLLTKKQVRNDERTGIDHLVECVEADPFDQLFGIERGCGRLFNPEDNERCPWCGNTEYEGVQEDTGSLENELRNTTYKKLAEEKQKQ